MDKDGKGRAKKNPPLYGREGDFICHLIFDILDLFNFLEVDVFGGRMSNSFFIRIINFI